MRIGLIGAGGISATHARAARAIPGVEIVAVYGGNPLKAKALAHEHGGAACETLAAFLDTPMDVAAIGSPSALHAEQAIAAIRRGIHVLVEKPLDTTTEKIDAVIAAADQARVKAGVFFQDRLTPDLLEMKRAIVAGEIGAPVGATGRVMWYRPPEYYSDSRWRGTWTLDGGGALMNQGIHTVDTLQWLLGPVARVSARTTCRLHSIDVEDTAMALLEFASGAFGVLAASTAAYPGLPRRIEVYGTKGALTHEQEARPALVADATPHQRVLEDFLRAIDWDVEPVCNAREGRHSVAIVQAIYRSSRSGAWEKP